jgi:hypothetical protein
MPDTGAPYFIPYVEPTDLVRDYPGASEDLALAIVAALEDIPVMQKKVEAFTSSGTWTVPSGVTYAIAHMLGGGGGTGEDATGGNGATSSVAFATGTVESPGGIRGTTAASPLNPTSGPANSGQPATIRAAGGTDSGAGNSSQYIVAGSSVTPAAAITVTVGAGGSAGTAGAAGGSGYVWIEYSEEV